uniref:Male-specific Is5 protein n=1 Tax=Rhipicephalus appendiculatus TaxID=34631 RepID=A0A131Z2R6_RHIAP
MRAPRVCLLLLVVLLSANFIEALSYQLEQPREFQDDPDDTDLDDDGGDEPFEESDDEATEEEGPSEEDGDQEDEDEEDGTYEEEIESRTGRKSRGRVQGLSGHSGQMMLGEQRRVIHEIEIVIDLGRKFEKNLTTMRELVNKEMEKSRSRHEIMVCKKRIAGIDKILTQVHTRNDQTEARFRTLLKRILSGEIRSKQRSRVLLQGLLTGYRTSLHSLFRNSSGFLRSIVQGVSGALSHLGMGILDIFRLKFQPFKFAINAITNGGSFRRPISSVLFGR